MNRISIRTETQIAEPEEGLTRQIPQTDVADMVKVPLMDGEYYIALNNYRKVKRMKKEPFFKAWERIGLIYKMRNEATGQNQWLPTDMGREFMIAHPKYPNAFGLYTGTLDILLTRYKKHFVAYYKLFEAEQDVGNL